jgi:Fe-S cluster biogenesis protein NfuA
MPSPLDDKDFHRRLQRLETSIEEFQRLPDANVRGRVQEIVRTLIDLHGEGLERILGRVADSGEAGLAAIDDLAKDEMVGGLLLLHGLHPLDLETRVQQALEKVRPHLHSHGGNVEVANISGSSVRLRLQGSCHSCPSSATTMKTLVEDAIYQAAPDVQTIEVDQSESSDRDDQAVPLNGRPLINLPILQR